MSYLYIKKFIFVYKIIFQSQLLLKNFILLWKNHLFEYYSEKSQQKRVELKVPS